MNLLRATQDWLGWIGLMSIAVFVLPLTALFVLSRDRLGGHDWASGAVILFFGVMSARGLRIERLRRHDQKFARELFRGTISKIAARMDGTITEEELSMLLRVSTSL